MTLTRERRLLPLSTSPDAACPRITTAALFPIRVGDYRLPNAIACEEDRDLFTGRDLDGLDSVTLFAEEQRLRRAIGIATGRVIYVRTPGSIQPTPADAWLRWRLRAVQDEMSRHRLRRST